MPVKLQLAHCVKCHGYISSLLLNKSYIHHPSVIAPSFHHEEPYFTFDKSTFEKAVRNIDSEVKVVNFNDHLKEAHYYCNCKSTECEGKIKNYIPKYENANSNDYTDQDIYFYDLYITYNNVHQDLPRRMAI